MPQAESGYTTGVTGVMDGNSLFVAQEAAMDSAMTAVPTSVPAPVPALAPQAWKGGASGDGVWDACASLR